MSERMKESELQYSDGIILAVEVAAEAANVAFQHMDWEWTTEGVPDKDRIRERIWELTDDLFQWARKDGANPEDGLSVSSGRLTVSLISYEEDPQEDNWNITVSLDMSDSALELWNDES